MREPLTKDEKHLAMKYFNSDDIGNPSVYEFISDLREYARRKDLIE